MNRIYSETRTSRRRVLWQAILVFGRKEFSLILVTLLCLVVCSASRLFLWTWLGQIVDHAIKSDRHQLNEYLQQQFIIFGVFVGFVEAIRDLWFAVVRKKILKTLQDHVFMSVIRQNNAYFYETTFVEVMSRLRNDVSSAAGRIDLLLSIVHTWLALIGMLIIYFSIDWKLSLLAFMTMVPITIYHLTVVYSPRATELNRTRYARLAEADSVASEALKNVRIVRAFSTETMEIDRFESRTTAAMETVVRNVYAYVGVVAVNYWLNLLASVLVMGDLVTLVMQNRMSVGNLITAGLCWCQILHAYYSIMSECMLLDRAPGAVQRVISLLDDRSDSYGTAGIPVSTLEGDIKLEHVHFHYQNRMEHPVLTGVNLHVRQGEVCALVGRSGGGKSTIMQLLMRFYDPVRGKILLDGQDLQLLNLKTVRNHMVLVTQDSPMFASSIQENIAYGLTEYSVEKIEEAARYAGAHDFIMDFPKGYATLVGERGVRLSSGQRQQIAIARMRFRQPKILLLDDLDLPIYEGGTTVVLVPHRLSTVQKANRIVVIEKGSVAEQGTHEELLYLDGVYRQLVQSEGKMNEGKRTLDDAVVHEKLIILDEGYRDNIPYAEDPGGDSVEDLDPDDLR